MMMSRAESGGARIGLVVPPGQSFLDALFAIWRNGDVAVPLALTHPPAELDHVIRDADMSLVVSSADLAPIVTPVAERAGVRVIAPSDLNDDVDATRRASPDRAALMLYTSGTTGKSKGVVITHGNLEAQVASLIEAWGWTPSDRTVLVLPLHHVHGLVNVVLTATRVGAALEMPSRFDVEATWDRLASGEITVFTAVPTIYRRLVASWEAAPRDVQRARSDGAARARLMMSGSAALPIATLERWREISGHTLLERYGMTEIGMGLSNPLHGLRRSGFVGGPLPGVSVRLVDDRGAEISADDTSGEIEVRGPTVFREYWRQPAATAAAFHDGWFRTGDVAIRNDGSYRLLGRQSTDIIKTGGEKVSALEIEDVLRLHPLVADCAVVGVADADWGERVCVAIELRPGASLALDDLSVWARSRLAPAKIPRALRCVTGLPRNAMGKVVKPAVVGLFDAR
jgi:malonyl-CoA/methylmalonyl-CoA synthetase